MISQGDIDQMRVAILIPVEGADNRAGAMLSGLVAGSGGKGVDITLFEPPQDTALDQRSLELLYVAKALEQAADFDLIHNCAGALLVSLSTLIKTPVLTTIFETLPPSKLPLYKEYDSRVFYINDTGAARSPGLNYVSSIDHDTKSAGFDAGALIDAYYDAYSFIIENKRWKDHRPWGHYAVLSDTPDQRAKLVHVFPGTRLSLQRHRRRHEHWHIIKGNARVTLNDQELMLKAGDSIDIPKVAVHRIANCGANVMTFFEVQTGDYLGEDDIERLEDDYARS